MSAGTAPDAGTRRKQRPEQHPLSRLGRFLDRLQNEGEAPSPPETLPEVIFKHGELGALWFTGDHAVEYRECVNAVYGLVRSKDTMSRKAAASLVEKALLVALDVAGTASDKTFQERKALVLDRLEEDLRAAPIEWEFNFAVAGIDAGTETHEVGTVCFSGPTEQYIASLIQRAAAYMHVPPNTAEDKAAFVEDLRRRLAGRTFASLKVSAVDSDAAKALALKEVRRTLDVLNFYADMLHSRGLRVCAALPGDTAEDSSIVVSFNANESHLAVNANGPLERFMLCRLWAEAASSLRVPRVVELLRMRRRTEIEERLLLALQTAGRATVEGRLDQAFLMHMVAVDGLLGGAKGESGTGAESYRLKLRCAHVLGATAEERARIFKSVGDLYGLRSRLAHSGDVEVTEADVARAAACAKRVIMAFLKREPFTKMQTAEDLRKWFESVLLT